MTGQWLSPLLLSSYSSSGQGFIFAAKLTFNYLRKKVISPLIPLQVVYHIDFGRWWKRGTWHLTSLFQSLPHAARQPKHQYQCLFLLLIPISLSRNEILLHILLLSDNSLSFPMNGNIYQNSLIYFYNHDVNVQNIIIINMKITRKEERRLLSHQDQQQEQQQWFKCRCLFHDRCSLYHRHYSLIS